MRAEVQKVLESSQELCTKTAKIMSILQSAGLAYKRREPVTAMLVHPMNRGGLMVHAHDAHANGITMLEAGLRRELLEAGSVCFEMSSDPKVRETQYEANERVVAEAEGLLGPVSRTERFLSVAGSHTAAFLKAAVCGARGADGSNLRALVAGPGSDDPVSACVREGWEWLIISSAVEESFPQLPSVVQQAYNTAHAAAKRLSEMECMQTFSSLFLQKRARGASAEESKGAALEQLLLGKPACAKYVEHMAQYVLLYGGGEGERFPLVDFLASFTKVFGVSVLLGEDFMRAVAATEVKGQLLPMTRCAFLACQLTAPPDKVKDGFARLLLPSDVEKLKAVALEERVSQTEECLARAWPLYVSAAALQSEVSNAPVKAMGRMMVRSVLLLLQKQKAGWEEQKFADLKDVSACFANELQGMHSARAASKAPKQRAQRSLTLQDCADPAVIALQSNKHLVLGERYTHKEQVGQVFVLQSLDAAGARFRGKRLFQEDVELVEARRLQGTCLHACLLYRIYI